MAPRGVKPPRCNACISRGRTSKCDRKNPCSACTKALSQAQCTYGAVPEPPQDPPPRPISPRGLRRPLSRATPSNCSILRSTLSPPPPVANDAPLAPPAANSDAADNRIPLPSVPFDAAREIQQLKDHIASLEHQAYQARQQRLLDADPRPVPTRPPTPPILALYYSVCLSILGPTRPAFPTLATMALALPTTPHVILAYTYSPCFRHTTVYQRAEAEVRAQPSISEIKHRTFVPGKQAPVAQALVHDSISNVFRNGWRVHVPLTVLTTRYRLSLTGNSGFNVIKWNDKGQALVKDTSSFSDIGEDRMSIEDWIDAWKCLLLLIERHQPLVAAAWADHYALIFHDPTFHNEFDLWLRYDIAVRKRWIDDNFDPSTLQEKIYRLVDRELAQAARGTAAHPIPTDRGGLTPSQRSRDPQGPTRALPSHNGSSQRYHPYRPPTSNRPSASSGPSARCLHCGGHGHLPRSCSASIRANGASVMVSTEPTAALTPIANMAPTYAHSVEDPVTAPSPAQTDPRKVITPLIPIAWHSILTSLGLFDRFSDVPVGLASGFRLGSSRSLDSTSTPPNHKSAHDAPDIIDAHIAKELALGRYSGPFDRSTLFQLIGHFRSAPLGLVSKPSAPGEYRMVQDFSFSHTKGCKDSVNGEIDLEEFPCLWGFFDDVVNAILDFPEGSMAATFDVDAAYRRIPIHPDDQPSTVVFWNGNLYVDHCAPFGAASSNGLFARCGDSMLLILQARLGCKVLKWVDDFLIIRPPPGYPGGDTTEQDIYDIAIPLGWPWKVPKTKDFAPSFEFLGFLWNIPNRRVYIPAKKCEKFLAKIDAWLSSRQVSLKSTQQLIGSLIHCTNVIPEGRAWLAGLIRFSASFPHAFKFRFITRPIPSHASQDATWWRTRLSADDCSARILPPPPEHSHQFFMDASTSFGIASIVNNHWLAWRLMQGWKSGDRDIGWAEMSAVELTLEAAIAVGLRDVILHFRSDNQGVIFALDAGRSRNTPQNDAIKRIHTRASIFGLRIRSTYIASAENPADPPSRGIPIRDMPVMPWRVPIPAHLTAFVAPAHLT
ncbi:unnamed protein product [Rhizoctonia solani]|uniref:CCHC-type domain-containing protein n=1 Tax=Rhizoctonia solani TaxID=456999 RepID=A0A8H3C789_9AGAM|nr:unnamed protein product [Rhizoctonia solani]